MKSDVTDPRCPIKKVLAYLAGSWTAEILTEFGGEFWPVLRATEKVGEKLLENISAQLGLAISEKRRVDQGSIILAHTKVILQTNEARVNTNRV